MSHYKPLSVVPYITEEEPTAKWSCRCTSGPEMKWKQKSNGVIQCEACNVYSHLKCYDLNGLNASDLEQYFYVCDNCRNNEFETKILNHALTEFILNKSNHPHKDDLYKKELLLNKWINYGNKYLSSISLYDSSKYNKNRMYTQYYRHFKNKKMRERDKKQLIHFKKEINAAIKNIETSLFDINDLNIDKYDNFGEWIMELQKLKCIELVNDNWLKLKYMKTMENDKNCNDENNGDGMNDMDGIDLLLKAAGLIEMEEQEKVLTVNSNNNSKKRKLFNVEQHTAKRQRTK